MATFQLVSLGYEVKRVCIFDGLIRKLKIISKMIIILVYSFVATRALILKSTKPGYASLDPSTFFLMIFALIPIICFSLSLLRCQKDWVLAKRFKTLKRDEEFLHLFHILLALIQVREDPDGFIRLNGFLRVNSQDYAIEDKDQEEDQTSTEEVPNLRTRWEMILQSSERESADPFDLNFEQKEERRYLEFLEYLAGESLKRVPGSARLRLFLASFLYHKLNKRWRAVYLLKELKNIKTTLRERLTAGRLMTKIEREITLEKGRELKEGQVSCESILNFENSFDKFISILEKGTEMNLEMWRELSNKAPDSKKIMVLGKQVLVIDKTIRANYKQVESFDLQKSQLLLIYGGYLRDVIHDEQASIEVLERATRILKYHKFVKNIKEGGTHRLIEIIQKSSNVCIIQVSAEARNFGEIVRVSRSIVDNLGYQPKEIIQENISILMPKFLGEHHNTLMRRYFETEGDGIVGTKRVVMAKNKKGYLIEMNLDLRVISNITKGLKLVGVIHPVDQAPIEMIDDLTSTTFSPRKSLLSRSRKEHFEDQLTSQIHKIQYVYETGEIIGVSESCYHHFGLKSNLFNQERADFGPTNIEDVISGISFPSNLQGLESENGMTLEINTLGLEQKLYLAEHYEQGNEIQVRESLSSNQGSENDRSLEPESIPSSSETNSMSQAQIFETDSEFKEISKLTKARIKAKIAKRVTVSHTQNLSLVDLHIEEIVEEEVESFENECSLMRESIQTIEEAVRKGFSNL